MALRSTAALSSSREGFTILLAVALSTVCASMWGCRTFTPVDVVVLHEVRSKRLNEVERLAIVGFQETGEPGVDSFLAAECERRLQSAFQLVSRSRVKEILQERNLWAAVFSDQPTQRKAGEILQASHLLIGTVVKYDCTDKSECVEVNTVVHEGYDWFLLVPIPREVVRMKSVVKTDRNAEVKLALRIVDVNSSENLFSSTATAVRSAKPSMDGSPPLPEKEVLLQAATESAFSELLFELMPTRTRHTIMVAAKGGLNEGVDFLRAGELDRAMACFRAHTAGSLEPYAWYDIGVVCELRRDFTQAEEAYRHALGLRPAKKMFQLALSRVRGRNR